MISRLFGWLRLARREESWRSAQILVLRHQLRVLQRQIDIEEVDGEEVRRHDCLGLTVPELRAHVGPSHRCGGGIPAVIRISHTVDGATRMPRPASSPWIRR